MKKNVWIINQYITTPNFGGDGGRHYYIAKELASKGYSVTLITASFSHLQRIPMQVDKHFNFFSENGINIVVVKTNKYQNSSGISRILSMFLFTFKLFFLPFKKISFPNFIIVSSISLFPIINGYIYKKRLNSIPKLIFEIRDIWPLSIIELGNYSPSNPFVRFLAWVEKFGYQKADYLTSVLPLANQHFTKILGYTKKFKHISNGIFLPDMHVKEITEENIILKSIPKNKFIVGYTGSLGIANAMEYFVEAANLLKDNKEILFCIIGEGPEKMMLQELAKSENIIFLPKIPKVLVQVALEKFDIVFIGSRKRNIYEFGVSANKTFDYMYAAKPILMTGIVPQHEIELAQCGIAVESDNVPILAEAVLKFYNMSKDERREMGKRAKEFVLEHRTFSTLANQYIKVFNELE